MNKETFYADIMKTYSDYGMISRKLLVNTHPEYNVGWQLSKYNGLKAICSEIGIPYTQATKISNESIKKDFLRVWREQGRISSEIYNEHGTFSISVIKSHFGGIANLMNECDIPLNLHKAESKEDVIKDFTLFYEKYHTTSSTIYRKYGTYCEGVIVRLFGLWTNLVEEAGLKPLCQKVGKEYMLQKIVELYKKFGFLSAKLINDHCDFTYQAASNYYSMDEISNACGEKDVFLKFGSTGEKVLSIILPQLFGEVYQEYTADWLINPETGKHLYIDFYIPSLQIGIEYDGKHHEQYIEFLHGDYGKYKSQTRRDELKDALSEKNGIKIIRIKYSEAITKDFILHITSNI